MPGDVPKLRREQIQDELESPLSYGVGIEAAGDAELPTKKYVDDHAGTTDHAALSHLDYASAGHTGFTPTTHITDATGVHGVGASTVESAAGSQQKVDAHAGTPHPTSDEKAALAGTDGIPSGTNKYVTNSDPRNSDARTPVNHQHSANDVTSDTLDGDRLPAMSQAKRGGVPATGNPSGLFLRDDGTWQSAGGGGGGAGNILIASMAQTTDPSYVVIGIVALDPDDFPGLDIRFAIVAAVTDATKAGTIQLYDLTGGAQIGIFTVNTTQPTRQVSGALPLTSGVRLYEVRIKSSDVLGTVICYGACFEVR